MRTSVSGGRLGNFSSRNLRSVCPASSFVISRRERPRHLLSNSRTLSRNSSRVIGLNPSMTASYPPKSLAIIVDSAQWQKARRVQGPSFRQTAQSCCAHGPKFQLKPLVRTLAMVLRKKGGLRGSRFAMVRLSGATLAAPHESKLG